MDFRTPDFILNAIRHRCEHEVLGYAVATESYWLAVQQWLSKRYRIESSIEELHFIPGIVAGISFVLQAMTGPDDGILVTTPVYPPFLNLPKNGQRKLVPSPLKISNGRFCIDFENLEKQSKKCKWMILSNPHNPGGTVWDKNTLEKIADICYRNKVNVIADEIHADLTLPSHKHISFSTVSQQARDISITFIAPSKTFNMAGLSSSICYCPNLQLRSQLFNYLDGYEVANGNIFAFIGAEAAFTQGDEWLSQLLDYLQANVNVLQSFLRQRLPLVKAILPEASFLAWLDFSDMGLSHEELKDRFINHAHVALNDGTTFGGADYRGCFRINLGCPRATLEEVLERLADSLQ